MRNDTIRGVRIASYAVLALLMIMGAQGRAVDRNALDGECTVARYDARLSEACERDRMTSQARSDDAPFERTPVSTERSPHRAPRELYVDVDSIDGACSDQRARDRVERSRPWCTLSQAARQLVAGDRLIVRAGVYDTVQRCRQCTDDAVFALSTSGLPGAPIRIEAARGERVILDGRGGALDGIVLARTASGQRLEHVYLRGFEVRDFRGRCVSIENASDIRIEAFDLHDCTGSALEVYRSERVLIANNHVHDNPMANDTSAIDVFECALETIIRDNSVWNNTDASGSAGHGIIVEHCQERSSTIIENNRVWTNAGACIVVSGTHDASVRHNTCWYNGQEQGQAELVVLGHRFAIHNNILAPAPDRAALLVRSSPEGMIDRARSRIDGNLFWGPLSEVLIEWGADQYGSVADYQLINPYGWGQEAIEADPGWVDPLRGDFHLMAGSAAIDTAVETGANRVDALGQARRIDGDGDGIAQSDRGAIEFVRTATERSVLARRSALDPIQLTFSHDGAWPLAARLSASTFSGRAPLTVTFDASASTGLTIDSYLAFDFPDGVRQIGRQAQAQFTFEHEGLYPVFLTVIERGRQSTAAVEISVAPNTDRRTVRPLLVLSRQSGAAPLTVYFDGRASTSTHPIAIYNFDFGDFDGRYSAHSAAQHTYLVPGVYTAVMTVIDVLGNQANVSARIRVD